MAALREKWLVIKRCLDDVHKKNTLHLRKKEEERQIIHDNNLKAKLSTL
jgi:hypothetical protein